MAEKALFHIFSVFIVQFTSSSSNNYGTRPETYTILYEQMKEAYYDEDWLNCAHIGEKANRQFVAFNNLLIDCRLRCQSRDSVKSPLVTETADEFLKEYGSSLWRVTCTSRCRDRESMASDAWHAMNRREHYDFMQMCYYKAGQYEKAASAAITFLVSNPHHEYMTRNVKNYKEKLGVSDKFFIDLQAGIYQVNYKRGMAALDRDKYEDAIGHFTEAAAYYIESYNNCSVGCEIGHDTVRENDRNHEAIGAIADQVEAVVLCKSQCKASLSNIDLTVMEDLLVNVYKNLYQLHYKVGDHKQSAAYLSAVLLHKPADNGASTLRQTLREAGVDERWFAVPTFVADHYRKERNLKEWLNYLKNDYISQHSEGTAASERSNQLHEFLGGKVKVTHSAEELGGDERFVSDGLASPDECQTLVRLCEGHGNAGDGYNTESPHTDSESYTGLSIAGAIQLYGIAGHSSGGFLSPYTKHEVVHGIGIAEVKQLVKEKKVDPSALKLYLDLTEHARHYAQLYFGLHHLYFDFTHLVCRTSLGVKNRTDLSHQIHSDNCIIQDNGHCYKGPPAYTQRDYSGLLYLNGEFEGGEFFFTDQHFHEQASVRPQCGRLVSFNAGHYHGVKAVTGGRRCALAVWWTLDERFNERERLKAYALLDNMNSPNVKEEL